MRLGCRSVKFNEANESDPEEIAERYLFINEDFDGVPEALTKFAAIHDEVYFKMGIIVGACNK